MTKLPTLAQRRSDLCYSFAVKCTKNAKAEDMFPLNTHEFKTRAQEK